MLEIENTRAKRTYRMIKTNKMKAKILAGEPVFGVSVTFPAPEIAEMIGNAGYDWVMIDAEHGSHSPEDVYAMVLACELYDVTPIVRPQINQADIILRYMDRGAMGVQVPHVNTADEAEAAVRAVKFYPHGDRGLGGGRKSYGMSTPDFIEAANRETLVCVQIEHMKGAENLDEILEVDGVDVFFIGPSDLSQSMGFPGQRTNPEVQKVLAECFRKIHAAGKASGTPGGPSEAAENVAAGILYHYTHVPTMISTYSNTFFEAVNMAKANRPVPQEFK